MAVTAIIWLICQFKTLPSLVQAFKTLPSLVQICVKMDPLRPSMGICRPMGASPRKHPQSYVQTDHSELTDYILRLEPVGQFN